MTIVSFSFLFYRSIDGGGGGEVLLIARDNDSFAENAFFFVGESVG